MRDPNEPLCCCTSAHLTIMVGVVMEIFSFLLVYEVDSFSRIVLLLAVLFYNEPIEVFVTFPIGLSFFWKHQYWTREIILRTCQELGLPYNSSCALCPPEDCGFEWLAVCRRGERLGGGRGESQETPIDVNPLICVDKWEGKLSLLRKMWRPVEQNPGMATVLRA